MMFTYYGEVDSFMLLLFVSYCIGLTCHASCWLFSASYSAMIRLSILLVFHIFITFNDIDPRYVLSS